MFHKEYSIAFTQFFISFFSYLQIFYNNGKKIKRALEGTFLGGCIFSGMKAGKHIGEKA